MRGSTLPDDRWHRPGPRYGPPPPRFMHEHPGRCMYGPRPPEFRRSAPTPFAAPQHDRHQGRRGDYPRGGWRPTKHFEVAPRPQPAQELQQQQKRQHEQSQKEGEKQMEGTPCTVQARHEAADDGSNASPPLSSRAPQPAGKRTMPEWVEDCFNKDEMAAKSEELCGRPFLFGKTQPQVGMGLYLQLSYKHDGSCGESYRGWARMFGEITHVYDPPEVGMYAVYDGQKQSLSDMELKQKRSQLPTLPESIFGVNAICKCCRTAEQVVEQYGAVHGQRIKASMWLSTMDVELEPQLGGKWDIELVCNDNLDSMWVVCSMTPQQQAVAAGDDAAAKQAAAAAGDDDAAKQAAAAAGDDDALKQLQQQQQERPKAAQACAEHEETPEQQQHGGSQLKGQPSQQSLQQDNVGTRRSSDTKHSSQQHYSGQGPGPGREQQQQQSSSDPKQARSDSRRRYEQGRGDHGRDREQQGRGHREQQQHTWPRRDAGSGHAAQSRLGDARRWTEWDECEGGRDERDWKRPRSCSSGSNGR